MEHQTRDKDRGPLATNEHDWRSPDDAEFGTRALPPNGVRQERCTRCLIWATEISIAAPCGALLNRSYMTRAASR